MIEMADSSSRYVAEAVAGIRAMRVASSVQLTVARFDNGVYEAHLGRITSNPGTLAGMVLGVLPDVPPGQRRATWLLTDAVNMALCDAEAHSLLHW